MTSEDFDPFCEYKPITKEELAEDFIQYKKDCEINYELALRLGQKEKIGFFKWFIGKFKK